MNKQVAIFTHGGGRLGNQLLNFSHLIGWVEENQEKVELINMAFWKYAGLFQGTESNLLCMYPVMSDANSLVKAGQSIARILQKNRYGNGTRTIRRLLKYVFRIPSIERNDTQTPYIDIGDESFNSRVMGHRVILIGGWGLRNWRLFAKHQEKVREFLAPARLYEVTASSFIETLRHKYELLIGVWIRQDDYRIWENGKYFFETDVYISWMKNVLHLFRNRQVGFVVASSDQQLPDRFKGLDCHMATGEMTGRGHFFESLVELSLCDLVMSPPSTYGAWAAFMRNKPLLPLLDRNQDIDTRMILPDIFQASQHPEFSRAVN